MKQQEAVHEESWRDRKPNRKIVNDKPRVNRAIDEIYSNISKEIKLFDLGCGDGTIGKALLERGAPVVLSGCDISEIAVNRATESYDNAYSHNIDQADLPEAEDTYDIVICLDVLEHLLDSRHALNECHRILKPSGELIISIPNYGFYRYRKNSVFGQIPSIVSDERHLQTFNMERTVDMLDKLGFDVNETIGVGPFKSFAEHFPTLFGKTLIFKASPK